MTAASFDISISPDEYIAAQNRRPEEPLGGNRERFTSGHAEGRRRSSEPTPKQDLQCRKLIVDLNTSLEGYAYQTRQRRTP
jgi:hypothetical protein